MVDECGLISPVLFLKPDGYHTRIHAMKRIKLYMYVTLVLNLQLDAVAIALFPVGYSAFTPVERRIAPESRELVGVILIMNTTVFI